MGSLSTRFERTSAAVAAALTITVFLSFSAGSDAKPQPQSPPSLCASGEVILFSCPIRAKTVSVCGQSPGHSIYRFGRHGRIEMQSTNLRHASTGYSGGGESQISLSRNGYRYVLFDRTIRTGFGPDGHNDPQFSSGLLVQRSGRVVSSERCGAQEAVVRSGLEHYMAEGEFILH